MKKKKKKNFRDNGIDYKIILEEFNEYGMINSTLYNAIRDNNIK